jgi:hypothetical protein
MVKRGKTSNGVGFSSLWIKERIEEIRESIPDDSYYGSEEFQTLLALAYEQLLTTHDRERLRLLAIALASSGCGIFHDDDKEQLLRTFREVSLRDIHLLKTKVLVGVRFRGYEVRERSHLSRLLAAGIIDELIDSTVVIDRVCQPPDSFSIMAHMPIPPFYALSD